MNNKHTAVFWVLGLIGVFVILSGGYYFMKATPIGDVSGIASSTTTTYNDTPSSITDLGEFYDIQARYPVETLLRTSVGQELDTAATDSMRGFVENTIQRFKESGEFETLTPRDIEIRGLDERMYVLSISYTMSLSPKTVSYIFTMYEDTLGAHGNTYFRTFTFDLATGEPLSLSDLFIPSANYLERISEVTRKDLPVILSLKAGAPADKDMITSGTIPESDSFQNFAIDGDTLQIMFPPYQVAAYVFGSVINPIPLSTLSDILKPVYIP